MSLLRLLVSCLRQWSVPVPSASPPTTVTSSQRHCCTKRHAVFYQRGELECPDFQRELSELFDGVWTPDEVARIDRAWILGSYRGTAGLVDDLRAAGHRTACLSNTSHSHWDMLLENPAVARLDVRHASHLLRLHKPDRRIFDAALAALGLTPGDAHRAVHVGDDATNDVQGALDAGWGASLLWAPGPAAGRAFCFSELADEMLLPERMY